MTGSRLTKTSRFGVDLSRALANRGQELLTASDLRERVRALEPLEAYFIVKELGVEEATPILRHCSTDQLRAFIDLDCWDGDRLSAEDIDAWIAPFAAEDPLALADAFLNLDEEVQVWYLSQSLEVLDAADEDLPDPPRGVIRKTTPDTYYLIQARPGVEREVPPVHLVLCLYAHDLNRAFELLTAARWEIPSNLEEQAHQFRAARVESLGFPARQVAHGIFSPPAAGEREPFEVPSVDGAGRLPAPYAEPMSAASLLSRALAWLSDDDLLAHLEESLRYLINHAIIAYGDSPRDVRYATTVATRVRDTVSLGLEALLSPNEPLPAPESEAHANAAAELLSRWNLFDLFRHGHAQVRAVQAQARALAEDPAVEAWRTEPLDENQDYGDERMRRELLNALLETPPLYAGFDPLKPATRRAYGSKRELEAALAQLDEIAETVR